MSPRTPLLLVLGCAALGGCAKPGPEVEIHQRRTATRPSGEVIPGASLVERFQGVDNSPAQASDDLIDYDLPTGWQALAPTADRLVNLRPAGDPEASCALSFLQGSGGGLEANVNRWRSQLGAEPLSGAEVAALETVPMLSREATLVEVDGVFSGMGGGPGRAGFRLLGLIVCEPGGSLFLKFTGPGPLVEAEREHFLALARSLRIAEAHAGAGAAPSAGAGAPGPGALSWRAPPGWTQEPDRPMREVTFRPAPGSECYITLLPGDAGGLRANLDRWSVQFGGDRLSEEAYAALPRVRVLGKDVPVLELEGSFTGMSGTTQDDQGLLALACIREGDSVFVKLTGPAAVVHAERENFLAFVGSLEEAR